EMMRVTLQIVSATLFSVELDSLIDEIGAAVATLNRQTIERIITLVELPVWVPTARNRELHAATGFFDKLIAKQVADRRAAGPTQQNDLLGMLLSATDPETGEGMSDTQLRDEAVTMIAAGHETTANALAWCFHLLAQHPDIERRVGEEAANVLGDRAATLEDLPRLSYTKQVFQESMRLYPPVWAIGRGCQEQDEIGGYTIERGADVTMSPWVTQRHPEFWPDPLRFDPDRFAEGREIPKFAYFPFSGGARQCIGTGFAMMEGQIILATVLSRYRLVATGRPVAHEALITLRPRDGLPMLLKRVA
ncbi:MAG: cytochrome P450, partial [Polyangia bacterium]